MTTSPDHAPAADNGTSPRQPAYDAVYAYIRTLDNYLPADTTHRNAIIWRAVDRALDAMAAGSDTETHWGVGAEVVRYEDEATARVVAAAAGSTVVSWTVITGSPRPASS